ncbi:MAG: GLPGLI family protein [Prevotella sp.]|nr:GLPGLI family protein [Prevotella sp.]
MTEPFYLNSSLMKHLFILFFLSFSLSGFAQKDNSSNAALLLNYVQTHPVSDPNSLGYEAFRKDIRYFEVILKDGLYSYRKLPKSISMVNIMDEKVYVGINFKDSTTIQQADRLGKKFLIKDKLPKEEWVILDSTRVVAGWNCKLAVKKNDSWQKAWFTMDFPVACGPLGECGLPGLIVSYEFGNVVLTLESIEKVDKEVAPAPKGDKSMTIDEYTKFSQKANQEWRDEN